MHIAAAKPVNGFVDENMRKIVSRSGAPGLSRSTRPKKPS